MRVQMAAARGTVAVVIAVTACGAPPPAKTVNPRVAAEGKALYDEYCALCHGENGAGYAADNASALGNQQFLATVSDELLHAGIERGRPGTPMAAYGAALGGPLNDQQIRLMITYLRSLQREASVELSDQRVVGDPARGAAVYAGQCASCHGDKGQGKTAQSLNNPVLLGTASDAFLRAAIVDGRAGTPMPAFDDRLESEQINDVTALIRSWQRPEATPPDPNAAPEVKGVVLNPKGPTPAFPPLREGRYVPAVAVKAALDTGARLVLVDARPRSDWLISHLPGSVPVPYYEVDQLVAKLPNDGTWVIAYCGCPHAASGKVMDALRQRGFKNTAVIDEGFFVWQERGYPVVGRPKP